MAPVNPSLPLYREGPDFVCSTQARSFVCAPETYDTRTSFRALQESINMLGAALGLGNQLIAVSGQLDSETFVAWQQVWSKVRGEMHVDSPQLKILDNAQSPRELAPYAALLAYDLYSLSVQINARKTAAPPVPPLVLPAAPKRSALPYVVAGSSALTITGIIIAVVAEARAASPRRRR